MKLFVKTVTGDHFVVLAAPADLENHAVLEGHGATWLPGYEKWEVRSWKTSYVRTAAIAWAEEWKEEK